ncbi:hypothetical protein [Streptantibioticus cattleyicolor]|uniref:Abortive infection protein n=1 Tax=Streptantibioticus cattleyicolor (strain ATCC 35852 / DSM 46488 / JCM 4925 / NBRC 14057 / NRRL 8057) TaxID=1003195 RepID=F8JJU0_STREN|nr:hypothetical protein [Streptantibioticus cattleyicolor]AEW98633.1 hypothetical protein SCATT_p04400 [Streptantibioticus cattleyicolor NRRL 8057 = DSM 46488]CCB72307.1 conserved protein of unknown function [Streptantibioticus cattleyicolor NRRL 8057 = DSM 46488]
MRTKGITYDTGFFPGGRNTRTDFDPATVAREMAVIARELRCTAVRITGGDLERLTVAARYAAAERLQVWFSPFPCELTRAEMLPLYARCAERAEELRAGGARVVLVLGCESTLFAKGFVPGDTVYDRVAAITEQTPGVRALREELPRLLNPFLAEAAATARERFGGPVTYASGPWEEADWTPFDIVAVDAYRDRRNADRFPEVLDRYPAHGKPVAATEFGCATYRGAGDRGGNGWDVLLATDADDRLPAGLVRDEREQVRYFHEVLAAYERAGWDAAFWFTFAGYGLTSSADPRHDLDLGSFGVVRFLPADERDGARPGTDWAPKAVFTAMAETYGRR